MANLGILLSAMANLCALLLSSSQCACSVHAGISNVLVIGCYISSPNELSHDTAPVCLPQLACHVGCVLALLCTPVWITGSFC
jgi:hypothetical protein